MIGKVAVHVKEQLGRLDVQFRGNPLNNWPRGAITCIKYHLHSPVELELRGDFLDIRSYNVRRFLRSGAAQEIPLPDHFAQLLDLLTVNGRRPGNYLESV